MSASLKNQVALVTGAGRGIGAATAKLFANQGAKVGLLSRSLTELKVQCESINQQVGAVVAIPLVADVSQESEVHEAFDKLKNTFGDLNLLVNNAAIITRVSLADMSVEQWDQMMAVNLRGSFLCAREAFRQMKSSGHGGSIVNIGSLGGIRSTLKFEGFSAYSSSKHAIVGLTETLAVEGKAHRIRVNCVAPGAVDTKMLRDTAPFLKTSTTPEDVAKIIFFLSDRQQSQALSGATLEVHSNE